jgi:hypothetical protein
VSASLITLLAAAASPVAVIVSIAGLLVGRRDRRQELRVLRRQFVEAGAANVALELTALDVCDATVVFVLTVVNGGPAVARDVDIEIVRDLEDKPFFRYRVDSVKAAPVLLPGEKRMIRLAVPRATVTESDLEFVAGWYDSSGPEAIWQGLILFLCSDDPRAESAIYLPPSSGWRQPESS